MANRRRDIIAVAQDLFAAHGYERTSLEMIADGSGYSVGGIYNFFPGKDALYSAVLEEHGRAVADELLSCADGSDTGMAKLLTMAATAVERIRDFPEHARLTLASLTPPYPPARRRSLQGDNFRTVLGSYASAIREGQRDGTVRAGNPKLLAQYVGGLVLAHAHADSELAGEPDGIPLQDFLEILRSALTP